MYRIQLHAWSDCSRTVFVQKDANGIEGGMYSLSFFALGELSFSPARSSEYDSRKFIPNPEIIKDLTKEVHDKAVDQANHLFDD